MQPQLNYRPGDVIGTRFLVHKSLVSNLSEVYFCVDHHTNEPRVLKTFKRSSVRNKDLKEILLSEVKIWIGFGNHPNIVRCYFLEMLDGRPFIVMEWIEGDNHEPSLRSRIWHRVPDLQLALQIAIDVCRGLEHADREHSGIVHRDIKPQNILLGQGDIAKITDWGLAHVARITETPARSASPSMTKYDKFDNISGTPPYMAPEQWDPTAFLDARTDIYAVGCTMYELLTGRHPLGVETTSMDRLSWLRAWQTKHVASSPMMLPKELPKALNDIIYTCLAKEPDARFSSASELLREFETLYRDIFNKDARSVNLSELKALDYSNRGLTFYNLGSYPQSVLNFNEALNLDPSNAVMYVRRALACAHSGHFEEATADLNHALTLNPHHQLVLGLSAETYDLMGQYDEALKYFGRAIEIYPRGHYLHEKMGDLLNRLGRHEESISAFDIALATSPKCIFSLEHRGEAHRMAQHFVEAIADFDEALRRRPDSSFSLSRRGSTYTALRRYDEALEDLSLALSLTPDDPWALAERGQLHRLLAQPKAALVDLDRSLELDPVNGWTLTQRALIRQQQGAYSEALDDINRALELKPNQQQNAIRVGIYWQLGLYEDARSDIERLVSSSSEQDPRESQAALNTLASVVTGIIEPNIVTSTLSPEGYLNLGLIYIGLGAVQKGLIQLKLALWMDPNFAAPHYHLGQIYEAQGQYQEALSEYGSALQLESENEAVWIDFGAVHRILGHYEEAILACTMAIGLNAWNALTYNNRGNSYHDLGHYEKAIADRTHAIELDPQYWLAYFNRANSFTALDRFEEAIDDYKRTIELNPDLSQAYYQVGVLLYHMGSAQDALVYLDQSVQLGMSLGARLAADIRSELAKER